MSGSNPAIGVLEATLAALSEANVPDDLKAIAFTKVFDLIAGNASPPVPRPREPRGRGATAGSGPTEREGSGGADLQGLANKLGLDADAIGEIVHLDGDAPTFSIPTKLLPTSKKSAMKEIALLVAAARQGAGLEEWTSVNDIRPVCEHFNVLDLNNFGAAMQDMSDWCSVRGKATSRELKMKQSGWEKASERAAVLTDRATA